MSASKKFPKEESAESKKEELTTLLESLQSRFGEGSIMKLGEFRGAKRLY